MEEVCYSGGGVLYWRRCAIVEEVCYSGGVL